MYVGCSVSALCLHSMDTSKMGGDVQVYMKRHTVLSCNLELAQRDSDTLHDLLAASFVPFS